MTGRRRSSGRTVYFEFIPVGRQVRVAAIDEETGTEVVIFGPASTSQAELERIAMAKLRRRLEATHSDDADPAPGVPPKTYI
ncbi:DUF6898 family protein [Rhodobium gokarnense]|uniref:DUF6898 domain-containing protein n=1 Tax=Rhodobium gokarnense TaxID=364296 RepID=A0ABT3HG13_9HYPH|nr:serine hydroxymethyltransferase [Rhodobium gokarnense]MCW2309320.1 hypothetical protein [Rhodobium gokarnense]